MGTDNDMADVFLVKKYIDERGEERQKWVKIGVAFPHRNSGSGYSLRFDIYPDKSDIDAGHNIVIRTRDEYESGLERRNRTYIGSRRR